MPESLERTFDRLSTDSEQFEERLLSDIRVLDGAMSRELSDQAYRCAIWGQLAAIAESKLNRSKVELETIHWPIARAEAKELLLKEGEKPTDKAIEARAYMLDSYRCQKEKYLNAEMYALIFKKAEQAIYVKSDMLQSLSSRQKAELTNLPGDENEFENLKDNARKLRKG